MSNDNHKLPHYRLPSLEDITADLWAHDVLLGCLAYEASTRNSSFKEEARASFDHLLDRRLAERDGQPDVIEQKARNKFLALLNEVTEDKGKSVKKPSLRRRFLRWLEAG
jgi:hypothetical protein